MDHTGVGNATWLELIWTLAGTIGMLNIWFLLLAAAGDRSFVHRSGKNGIRRMVSDMSFWSEMVSFYIVSNFTVIGLLASSQPPSNPNKPITPTAIVITVSFCSISFILNLNAILRRRTRNRIIAYETKRELEQTQHDLAQSQPWDGAERRSDTNG